jgi:hypothetical protein
MPPAHRARGFLFCLKPAWQAGSFPNILLLRRARAASAGYAAMLIIPAYQARSEASIPHKE